MVFAHKNDFREFANPSGGPLYVDILNPSNVKKQSVLVGIVSGGLTNRCGPSK